MKSTEIYLEIGKKKVFAVALDWPGWSRFAKDENSAIQALLDYGSRYAKIPQAAGIAFHVPESPSAFNIINRLDGNATTDFGGIDIPLPNDWDPIEDQELDRIKKLTNACWLVFDEAAERGKGKELKRGPRGGGRDLEKIIAHVTEAEEAYLKRLGWTPEVNKDASIDQRKIQVRNGVLRGLEVATGDQLPREGPRGGKRWPPRFFVRRLAWHVVDHTWEIEDRIIS